MTDLPPPPPPPPPRQRPPAPRDGCVTALMIVVGIGLLLPGICVLAFSVNDTAVLWRDLEGALRAFIFAVAGIGLIWIASRRPR